MMKPDIDLHIEELVLRGFALGDRYRIGAAVERELARLFTEQGVPESMMHGSEMPNLALGSFHVKQGARPEMVGAQVAQAVYKGLSVGVPRAHTPVAGKAPAENAGQAAKALSKGGGGK